MGAPIIKGFKNLVGGRWASDRSHSRVAAGASAQHVVRTQNISGSRLQINTYIILLYFVIKSDVSSWPNLNPAMGVISLLEFEGEEPREGRHI
jgi:hypothetical protein